MATPVDSLYTVLQNVSGATRKFHYLGEKGITLAADAVYKHPGHLPTLLAARGAWREFRALEKDLDDGVIALVRTPGVYLTDIDDDSIKQLELDGGTVETTDPVEGAYYSSEDA